MKQIQKFLYLTTNTRTGKSYSVDQQSILQQKFDHKQQEMLTNLLAEKNLPANYDLLVKDCINIRA